MIFDFDGTIADTLPLLVHVLNRLSGKYGYRQVKESELGVLRGKTSKEILKSIGISMLKLPFVVRSARQEFRTEVELLKPAAGVKKALLQLKKSGCRLGIATSNSEENVKKFLKINNLQCFDFIVFV